MQKLNKKCVKHSSNCSGLRGMRTELVRYKRKSRHITEYSSPRGITAQSLRKSHCSVVNTANPWNESIKTKITSFQLGFITKSTCLHLYTQLSHSQLYCHLALQTIKPGIITWSHKFIDPISTIRTYEYCTKKNDINLNVIHLGIRIIK